ncbi:MAG: RnfABCDGE type electron transport complex subunit G [Deferribacterota bacterium]|nr:RnfABCDGE type electron transport complex subunit G [Deferribacterota bacterium]
MSRLKEYKMLIVLTVVTFVSALLVSFVYTLTREDIQKAYREEFLAALKKVLPAYDNEPDRDFVEINGNTVYLAKKDNKIIAYAMRSISKKGYGGDIVVLVGVDTSGKITGIEILRHSETPGLGNKITKKEFKDSFKGLSIKDKIAVKKDGGIIDSFAGATISPRAVCEAVDYAVNFLTKEVIKDE